MLALLGLIGNIGLSAACIPMAFRTYMAGRSLGTPIETAWTFLVALTSLYVYLIGTYGFDPMIWVTGVIEIVCWIVVIRFHYFPR